MSLLVEIFKVLTNHSLCLSFNLICHYIKPSLPYLEIKVAATPSLHLPATGNLKEYYSYDTQHVTGGQQHSSTALNTPVAHPANPFAPDTPVTARDITIHDTGFSMGLKPTEQYTTSRSLLITLTPPNFHPHTSARHSTLRFIDTHHRSPTLSAPRRIFALHTSNHSPFSICCVPLPGIWRTLPD